MNKLRRAFADLSVGQVHYASAGPASAPAVLLLHQSPRSWREYASVIPILAQRWRVIAMDTVGFGDSEDGGQPASIEHYAAVALELLTALELDAAHVVGHHTGGVVAVEMAAQAPARVKSLVLSSTPFVNQAFRIARAERPPIDEVHIADSGEHLLQLWRARQGFYPAGRTDLLQAFVRDALAVSNAEDGHRAVAAYRMEDRLGQIEQPVCIVKASADPFAAPHAQEWLDLLPQAQLVEIAQGMVPLPDQLPQEFAAAVDHFLQGLDRPA